MQPQPNTLVRMALPPIPTPPRTRTRRRGPMVPPITPPPRRGCKPRPVASPITPPAHRVKRTKTTPEAKAAFKLVDAAARGGEVDLLALSSKFWTDAVECRTPKFLEELRRTDPPGGLCDNRGRGDAGERGLSTSQVQGTSEITKSGFLTTGKYQVT